MLELEMQAGPQSMLSNPVARARNASTRNYKPLYTDPEEGKKNKNKETDDSEEEEADNIKNELNRER